YARITVSPPQTRFGCPGLTARAGRGYEHLSAPYPVSIPARAAGWQPGRDKTGTAAAAGAAREAVKRRSAGPAAGVTRPARRRRPGLGKCDADGFKALQVAEDIQAPRDVLRSQADVFQRHALQRSQVGDAGALNLQPFQRHVLEVGQARVAHLCSPHTENVQAL